MHSVIAWTKASPWICALRIALMLPCLIQSRPMLGVRNDIVVRLTSSPLINAPTLSPTKSRSNEGLDLYNPSASPISNPSQFDYKATLVPTSLTSQNETLLGDELQGLASTPSTPAFAFPSLGEPSTFPRTMIQSQVITESPTAPLPSTSEPSGAHPTSKPSLPPLVAHSLPPSGTPSLPPSAKPSSPLSVKPSLRPSVKPSLPPSATPSIPHSVKPSLPPSVPPSLSRTVKPSLPLSVTPTLSRSVKPSLLSSVTPSSSRSVNPSLPPSVTPSSSRSVNPSLPPSVMPSFLPSTIPSSVPTLTPSSVPTPRPSSSPSDTPSLNPSMSPTLRPSNSPSSFPSSYPTLACHDSAFYRSPIKNLTCIDHAETDCPSWRFVGLNSTQLEDLIRSCPISCNIPCGTFNLIDTKVSFVISGLSGLMDVVSQESLEEVAKHYLENFVQDLLAEHSAFRLDTVELKSQLVIRSKRNLRRLQVPTFIQLQVVLSLFGFFIGEDHSAVDELLLAGIDSDGFTGALRLSNSFYENADASPAIREIFRVAPAEMTNAKVDSASSVKTITLSVLAGLSGLVVLVGTSYILKGWCFGHPQGQENCSLVSEFEFSMQSESTLSGRVVTFDQSSLSATQHHGNQRCAVESAGDLAIQQRSCQEEMCGLLVNSDVYIVPISPPCNTNMTPTNVISEANLSELTDEEHPMAKLIPPMIVIDNIDGDDAFHNNSRQMSENYTGGVPVKRVAASDEFKEALCSIGQITSLASFHAYNSYDEQFFEQTSTVSEPFPCLHSQSQHPGIFDENDALSVNSTPVNGSEIDLGLAIRRSFSSSALDRMNEQSEDILSFGRAEWAAIGLQYPADTTPQQLDYISPVDADETSI